MKISQVFSNSVVNMTHDTWHTTHARIATIIPKNINCQWGGGEGHKNFTELNGGIRKILWLNNQNPNSHHQAKSLR